MSIDAKAHFYLGRPWLPGGRGHSGGLDCLGLALEICDPPPPDVRSLTFNPDEMADGYELVTDADLESGDLLISHSERACKRIAHIAVAADNPSWAWTSLEKVGVVKVRSFKLRPFKAYRRK